MNQSLPFTAPAWPVQLRRSLSADVLKLKNTAALWLSLLCGALPVLLTFLIYFFKGHLMLKPGQDPWGAYVQNAWQVPVALLLPMFIVLLAGLLLNVENKAAGWKHLYALPVSRLAVFGSKLLLLLGLNLLAQLTFAGLLLLSGWLLGWLRPELHFQDHTAPVLAVARLLLHTHVATLGILGLQYMAALWWRSFVPPLALGIACLITALTITRWEHIEWVPYAAPLLSMQHLQLKQNVLSVAAPLAKSELVSLGWLAAATLLGYPLLRRRHQG